MNEVLGGKEAITEARKKGEKRELSKIQERQKVGYEIRNRVKTISETKKNKTQGKKMYITRSYQSDNMIPINLCPSTPFFHICLVSYLP